MNKRDIADQIDVALAVKQSDVEDGLRVALASVGKPLALYRENDWSGEVAQAHLLNDGSVLIVTAYFGSCDYCDEWMRYEGCDAERAKMLETTILNGRLFECEKSALAFCVGLHEADWPPAEDYAVEAAQFLVDEGEWDMPTEGQPNA